MANRRSIVTLRLLALTYFAFVIYGSLVPLDFQPRPLHDAWATFRDIRYLDLGIGSRADWVANILLYIPLSFLWLGGFASGGGRTRRVISSVVLWLGFVLLSCATEFVQIFFPPRTISVNDILAESMGATIGILLWWWRGPELVSWFERWQAVRSRANLAERLLWVYVTLLFAYNLLPLDLTISPVELFHKWNEGRIVFVPFAYPVESAAQRIYDFSSDILLWVPVSLLWILTGRRSPSEAWRWATGAAVVLEVLQLFVYSRVSDITDVIAAMIGAATGVLIGRRWAMAQALPKRLPQRRRSHAAHGIVAFLIWSTMLAIVFWFPFDFDINRESLRERIDLFSRVPFYNYYYGTEFRAITEFIHKLVFFIPLGLSLGFARESFREPIPRLAFDVTAVSFLLGVAFVIELGQVALPSKFPDSTDWILESLGALLGYAFGPRILKRLRGRPDRVGVNNSERPPPRVDGNIESTETSVSSRYDWPE